MSLKGGMVLALWTALMAAAPAGAQLIPGSGSELLDPEKAFRIAARALDESSVEVRFEIAEGYYLYRDRFSFATETGERLADVHLPRGVLKEDAFFGKSETFRREVRIRVRVPAREAAKGTLNLKITSQGCADIGVCYVPVEQTVRVALPRGNTP